jgi:hypothetical protein
MYLYILRSGKGEFYFVLENYSCPAQKQVFSLLVVFQTFRNEFVFSSLKGNTIPAYDMKPKIDARGVKDFDGTINSSSNGTT